MLNYNVQLKLNKTHHVELSEHDRARNIIVTGLPSTGVSTFVADLIFQDVKNDIPTIVFDPYGYMTTKILSGLASDQLEKTAYLDIGNGEYPIGLNLFQTNKENDKNMIANTVIDLIYSLYDPNKTGVIGPRFDHAVRNAVLTVLYDDKSSFIELIKSLTDGAYIHKLLPKITDLTVKNYWTKQIANTSDFHKSEVLDYIVSKFGRFVTDPKIRNILNQTTTNLEFDFLLSGKKLIIFDFSKFIDDPEALKILCEIVLLKIGQSLKRINKKKRYSLFVDEVDLFPSKKITEFLRFSGVYGLNLCLITQRMSELEEKLRNELLRAGTVIAFRLSFSDASIIAPLFHKNISIDSLCMMSKYHMTIKTLKNGNPVVYEELNNVIEISENSEKRDLEKLKIDKTKTYGTYVKSVEEDIRNRLI